MARSEASPAPLDVTDNASPLVRIRSLFPDLARAEQRVAKVVLADPSTVASRSITELALAASTSETTVTRFCKAIGVGGYPQLRIALAADTARTLARNNRPSGGEIRVDDDLSTVVNKISYSDSQAVEDTATQLDLAALSTVIDAVVNARRIDIYSVGASALTGADLQRKLHRMSMVSFSWSDTHFMLTSAAVLTRGDLAIGISHSGTTTDTVKALRVAKERGATTVALTNFVRAPITEVADLTLTTATTETPFRSGSTASRVAQLTVIDCLIFGVAQKLGEEALTAMQPPQDVSSAARTKRDRTRKPAQPPNL